MRADLAGILSDLDMLTTEQALKQKLDRTFANLGFNSFTYLGIKSDPSEPAKRQPSDIIFLSNVRPAFIDHYVEHELGEDDPLIKDCMSSRLPIRWNEQYRSNSRSQRESRIFTV